MKVIESPKDPASELNERNKELNCIYEVSDLLNHSDMKLDEMIDQIIYLIQSAMKFPPLTSIMITVKDKEYKSQNFKKSIWKISNKINEGENDISIEVYSMEDILFTNKKLHLIEDIAFKLKIFLENLFQSQTEHNLAEQRLRVSEEMFRSIFMNSPIAIELYDSDGKLLDVNRACLDMFGALDINSVKGFDLFQDPNVSDKVKMKLHAGEIIRYESEFDFGKVKELNLYETAKSGIIDLDISITPLYQSGANSISNYLVQVQDITKAKQAEELLDIQNRISRIFLTVPDEEMYPEVLDTILEVLNCKYGVFGYLDEQSNCVCPSMTRDIWDRCQMEDKTIVFPRESWKGIWGKCLIEKKPVYSNIPSYIPEGHVKIDNALSVPIVFQDKSIGHFNIANKIGGFNQNDIELLTAIANWTAPILQARLQRDIQEQKRKKTEENLKKLNDELEQRIEKRTKTLEESETRLKIAQKMVLVGDWEYEIRNNTLIWSEELYRIYDFDPNIQLHIGMLGDKIHPDDREWYDKNTQNWIENGEGDVYEHRIVLNDGSIRYIYGICDVSLGDDGKPIKMFGTLQDITERKIAEKKLKNSEEKYRRLFEDMIIGIWMIDSEFNTKLVNPHMAKMLGYEIDEMFGKSLFNFMAEKNKESALQNLKKQQEGTAHIDIEFEFLHRNGTSIYTQLRASTLFDDHGNFNGAFAFIIDISEKKKVEDELRLHSEMMINMSEGVNLVRAIDQTIIYTNPGFDHMFGYNSGELSNKPVSILNAPSDKKPEELASTLKEHIEKKGEWHGEILNIKKDGTLFWCYVNILKYNHPEHDKVFISVHTNITERKKAEDDLSLFKTIVESSHEPIAIADSDGDLIYINPAHEKLFGRPLEVARKMNYREYYPAESVEIINNIATPALARGESWEGELDVFDVNGRLFPLWERADSILDEEGNMIYAFALMHDISDKKEAEEELVIKNYALTSSINAIAISDLAGNLTFINPSFLKMWGYSNETEILGKNSNSFWASEEKANKVILHLKNKHNWSGELIGKKKNGVLFDVLLSASLVMDKKNNPICMMATFMDITKRKRAEQLIIEENRKLRELSEMKRDIITRVSHELKTPLTSIHGASYYLLNYHKGDMREEILEYLEIIHRGGLRLKSLVDDLLDISRLESGKLELKKTEVNLTEIIKDSFKDVNYFASHRNLMMKMDLPDKVLIQVDKIRIGQVITNILSNAIKNTPPYGEISINLNESIDDIFIQVKDNGVGITKEERQSLFKRFGKIERYGKGMDVDTEGSGLGLYISKEIVELHNGNLFFESEGRNKGTRFTIKLPKTLL